MKKVVWCSCIGCLAIVAVSGMYSMEWIRSVGNYISGGTVAVYNAGVNLVSNAASSVGASVAEAYAHATQTLSKSTDVVQKARYAVLGATALTTYQLMAVDMQKSLDQLNGKLTNLKNAVGLQAKAEKISEVMLAFKAIFADLLKPIIGIEEMASYATNRLGLPAGKMIEDYRRLTVLYQTYLGALLDFLSKSMPGMFEYLSQLQTIATDIKPMELK